MTGPAQGVSAEPLEVAEAALYGGNLAGAAAILDRLDPSERASWAAARLSMAIALVRGQRPPPEALAGLAAGAARPGQPPADLPALVVAFAHRDGGRPVLERAVLAERRLQEMAIQAALQRLRENDAAGALPLTEHAIAALPPYADAYAGHGRVRASERRFTDTLLSLKRAVEIDPSRAQRQVELARAYVAAADPDGAVPRFAALARHPAASARLHCDHLYAIASTGIGTVADLAAAHRDLGARVPVAPRPPMPAIVGGRPVRVGFHALMETVGCAIPLLMDLLAGRRRERLEVFLYVANAASTFGESEMAEMANGWAHADALSDEALTERIRADRLDLLVDLVGLQPSRRVEVLAARPALVQVGWIEYPWSTGLTCIDATISDAAHMPPCEDHLHAGEILRLDTPCFAFPRAATDAPLALRAEDGELVFGWLGPVWRISSATLSTWWRILEAVPKSRLVLGHRDLHLGAARSRIEKSFEEAGLEPDRLAILPTGNRETRREVLSAVDIVLDSRPASHWQSAAEALAFGLPVWTIRGDRPVGRHAAAALAAVGLERYVFPGVDALIEAARAVADDRRLLPERAEVAARAAALADPLRLAGAFEALLDRLLPGAAPGRD